MNVGIIGCGAVAPKHVEAYLRVLNCNRFTFCDIIPERAVDLASNYEIGEIVIFQDYKKMLLEEDLDLVSICTPPATHAEIAIACAEAEVNVLCEKPIALNVDEARRMAEAFESSYLSVIFQNRWVSDMQGLKSVIEDRFRPLKAAMTVNWFRPDHYFGDWKGELNQGGDIVFNQIIHHFDILRHIFGEVRSVFAYLRNTRPSVMTGFDVCTAVLRFKNGVIATLDATTTCHPKNEKTELAVITDFKPFRVVPKGAPHDHQIRHVVRSLSRGKQPEVKPEDAIESLKLVLAVYESAESGKEIYL